MKLEGVWAWWNQYGPNREAVTDQELRRARDVKGVIVKWGYWQAFNAFRSAGIRVGIERYVYPGQSYREAMMLAEGIDRGAEFAVINAEAEWEGWVSDPMTTLISEFRRRHPNVELYGSVDSRGGRTELPYQRVLAQHITAWLPMIYPTAFGQTVERAFQSALDGKNFRGKPVLPTIQTYGNINPNEVDQEFAETSRRKLLGCQVYTIGHATDAMWRVVQMWSKEDDMWLDEIVIGLDGRPFTFEVVQADLSTVKKSLTWREFIRLDAWGLIVRRHTHRLV